MRVLVACEYSGRVRDAFASLGHYSMSCDLLPTDCPGNHYQGDVMDIIKDNWDLLIAFPPCTYLCSSGLHWNKRDKERRKKTAEALSFVYKLLRAPVKRIALENPVGVIGTRIRESSQMVQPYWFGEDASKSTCPWLKNLPLLKPTKIIQPRVVDGQPRWGNQTDSGQNNLSPSDDRWKERSLTYRGLAQAMADQWGKL